MPDRPPSPLRLWSEMLMPRLDRMLDLSPREMLAAQPPLRPTAPVAHAEAPPPALSEPARRLMEDAAVLDGLADLLFPLVDVVLRARFPAFTDTERVGMAYALLVHIVTELEALAEGGDEEEPC